MSKIKSIDRLNYDERITKFKILTNNDDYAFMFNTTYESFQKTRQKFIMYATIILKYDKLSFNNKLNILTKYINISLLNISNKQKYPEVFIDENTLGIDNKNKYMIIDKNQKLKNIYLYKVENMDLFENVSKINNGKCIFKRPIDTVPTFEFVKYDISNIDELFDFFKYKSINISDIVFDNNFYDLLCTVNYSYKKLKNYLKNDGAIINSPDLPHYISYLSLLTQKYDKVVYENISNANDKIIDNESQYYDTFFIKHELASDVYSELQSYKDFTYIKEKINYILNSDVFIIIMYNEDRILQSIDMEFSYIISMFMKKIKNIDKIKVITDTILILIILSILMNEAINLNIRINTDSLLYKSFPKVYNNLSIINYYIEFMIYIFKNLYSKKIFNSLKNIGLNNKNLIKLIYEKIAVDKIVKLQQKISYNVIVTPFNKQINSYNKFLTLRTANIKFYLKLKAKKYIIVKDLMRIIFNKISNKSPQEIVEYSTKVLNNAKMKKKKIIKQFKYKKIKILSKIKSNIKSNYENRLNNLLVEFNKYNVKFSKKYIKRLLNYGFMTNKINEDTKYYKIMKTKQMTLKYVNLAIILTKTAINEFLVININKNKFLNPYFSKLNEIWINDKYKYWDRLKYLLFSIIYKFIKNNKKPGSSLSRLFLLNKIEELEKIDISQFSLERKRSKEMELREQRIDAFYNLTPEIKIDASFEQMTQIEKNNFLDRIIKEKTNIFNIED
jgi:hypothetical protein